MDQQTAPSDTQLDPQQVTNEAYELFNLDLADDKLIKMCVQSLNSDISHWQQKPWLLKTTDTENINYLLGDQLDLTRMLPHQTPYIDNRLHASVRAILSYATGQLAKPELLPSKPEDRFQRIAKNLESFLYQHALDHEVNSEMRLALKNLITRKRGFLKLRFDEYYGAFGDVCTENIDPADIVIDRFAGFRDNPQRIYHKQKCTIEALIAKFPDKETEIKDYYDIVRGTFSQLSRMVTYWECWFTYYKDGKESEGVCWFIPDSDIILGKMQNPNWVYTGSDKTQRIKNLWTYPPKPFICLNYLNTGRSYIDETCLLDQAIPLQNVLNKRGRQIVENADYANPRMLIDKRVMEEADAKRFVNKHPKTIGMVDTTNSGNDIAKAVFQIPAAQLPSYVMEDKFDARNEIDTMMGTPQQFRGEQPISKSPTLGQDLMIKNQASALQDDLVNVVNLGFRQYYALLLQMVLVYLPSDYWLMTRGTDGEYMQISLQDDNLDTNVRIGVQTDSTLPLDKQSQRATAIQLAQIPGRIDDLSLFEMLGLPDPEKLAERVQKFNVSRIQYMESIEQQMYNAEAETDITMLIANKQPEDRETYNESYINYWNTFMTTNRFQKLQTSNPQATQRLTNFLHEVANKAALTESLKDSMLNPAGMLSGPPPMPIPKETVRLNIDGTPLNPQQTAQVANVPPPAQDAQPSPPRLTNPNQFGP